VYGQSFGSHSAIQHMESKKVLKIFLYIGILMITYSAIMYLAEFLPIDLVAFFKGLLSGPQSNEPYSKIVGVNSLPTYQGYAMIVGIVCVAASKLIPIIKA
jgi:hypothetical protein